MAIVTFECHKFRKITWNLLPTKSNVILTITEMLNVTNISQHAVHSAYKINRIYFAMSVNVPSVYFIVNCTNLI